MIGQTLSHYKVLSKLGEGGMGAVYLAEDTELGRQVALKILPGDMADNPERLERFRREARAVAALDHPNIVRIHNFEEAGGVKLLVMEAVDGESLDKVIPAAGLPLAKVFSIAVPIADALAMAHEKGITHRDLKPANVMLTADGKIKVLDFGLAKMATEEPAAPADDEETALATAAANLTGEGVVMGTAPYMSPEQLQGKPVDPRTDIFSLGVMLYEMATGQRPFQGDTGIDLASRILRETPSSVTDIRTDLPRHLGRIIQHCLEKDPERRYQSAKDVRNELEALQGEVASGPVATGSQPVMPASTAPIQTPVSGVPAVPASDSGVASGSALASDPGAVTPSGAQPVTGASRVGLWAAVAAALIIGAAGAWWFGRDGDAKEAIVAETPETEATAASTPDSSTSPDTPSVAVLPFADLSPGKDQEYFTDGMTEELLFALDSIDGLKVPSRTAVFALKGKGLDIQQVGDRLGVSTVLEGSVRKAGDQLRITAQLINVEDGFRLWTETYDRTMEDVFALQDEIAQSIAAALQVTLASVPSKEDEIGGTTNSEAYDFYLRGVEYGKRQTREGDDYSIQMYERALEHDPNYALAWSRLATSHGNLYLSRGQDDSDLVAAEKASRRAIESAPGLWMAHHARAYYFQISDQNAAAEEAYEEALRLGPSAFGAHFGYGLWLFRQGDLERTAALWEKATALDPDDPRALNLLPQVYTRLGRPQDAMDAYQRILKGVERYLELNPDDLSQVMLGATALLALGERQRAFEWAERIVASDSKDTLVLYNTGCFFAKAGEKDSAFEALEKGIEAGDRDVAWWRQDSDLDSLRDDPRFEELIARMEADS